MTDGMIIGSIISGFTVTWGWLINISYKLGRMEQRLDNLINKRKRR